MSANFADRYHWGNNYAYVERFNYNTSLSYVTGSHNIKGGFMHSRGPYRQTTEENGALRQRYATVGGQPGVPYEIGRSNMNIDYSLGYQDTAFYLQDTWTLDRLTLNLGLRWEQITAQGERDHPARTVSLGPADDAAGAGRHPALERHRAADRVRV